MKILFSLHTTGFGLLQKNEKEEVETSGEEMLCAILYLEDSDKVRFTELKKRVENYYVMSKAEYPRKVNSVQILLLNYQTNFSFNRNPHSKRVSNQFIFARRGKTGDDKGDGK